jgi:protein-arginine kinase activator protein McsA
MNSEERYFAKQVAKKVVKMLGKNLKKWDKEFNDQLASQGVVLSKAQPKEKSNQTQNQAFTKEDLILNQIAMLMTQLNFYEQKQDFEKCNELQEQIKKLKEQL